MSAARQYSEIVRAARRAQLAHDAESVRALERLLRRAADKIARELRLTPRGLAAERYRRQLLASLYAVLDGLRDDYKALLDGGIVESARLAEERERAGLAELFAQRGALRPDQALRISQAQAQMTASLGKAPRLVLERLYARSYPDGLKLSQRLYNLDLAARRAVTDKVALAIATGQGPSKLAAAIAPDLTRVGTDNIRYKAMRIARTEINSAYREGHVASVTNPDGNLKPYISAIGWRLSASHPRICICDALAGDDSDGLGPGNYLPENVPTGHPHCLCYTVSILAAYPDWQFVAKPPRPDLVSIGERKHYGVLDDH